MKRLNSSDSLGALISISPLTEDQSQDIHHVYERDYPTMYDEEDCAEERGHMSEKKRRLSVHQVKALEKNFEVENKLEPDRKAKLAQELGLQPRQVAVWFQNRRARWKTKQLERDYGLLKANYDALLCNFDTLKHENEALAREIRELKSKLKEDNSASNVSVKKELIVSGTDDNLIEPASTEPRSTSSPSDKPKTNPNFDSYNNHVSDSSNSSAILNEDNSPKATMSSSSLPHFTAAAAAATNSYQAQFVKIEEHDFFSSDEACDFFSDDQAPTLQWY